MSARAHAFEAEPVAAAAVETARAGGGRANQKKRTRDAIVRAAAELMLTGREMTMPEIARAALVSEATAYRYFPDLASLLGEAMADQLPDPAAALDLATDSADPVERVAAATEYLLRHVLARQGAVRAMIAATVVRPDAGPRRPGLRFGLIDHALAPLEATVGRTDPEALAQLKLGLAVVISAEALFALTDLQGLDPEAAVAGLVRTATALTRAALPSA
ncbi:TetR/AcrR family transcriptional regulator [Streptacidiphilus rugosus]|uniref:TetR/AcrR family transcriptional regulator n=1 Tax=Streptacidiphilus rugosus TaxID=405783 RepID=UPI0009FEFC09|nr:TetR/AcrR family transcriptional regulator [Streptacidiphilus rugosus]